MLLNLTQNGIVQRHDEGTVTVYRPHKNGSLGEESVLPEALADTYRLATGDVIEAFDNPTTVLASLNGLTLEEAEERPFPRTRRSASERIAPTPILPLSTSAEDKTENLLDEVAPLGMGCAGIVYGPHGSGLTYTLQAVLRGVTANTPEILLFVLLIRARGEERTDWRRKFPQAEIVVCPTTHEGATAEQTLKVATLVMECVQRQTELGKHVLLAIDSLTGLWGAMLEAEEADAQTESDYSQARQQIREWMQKAGNFGGEGLLGSGLGGSLTLLGTVWNQPIDPEAEEEKEVHPHLRLLEHILHETNWRVPLSGNLAQQRIYPAIDTGRCVGCRA